MPIGKIDANKAEMLRSVLNEENTYKNCNKNNLDNCISCSYIDNPSSELCYSKKALLKQTTRNNNFVHLNDRIPNSEQQYILNLRKAKAYTNLLTLSNDIHNQINVAFCGTGGGGKSCIATLGFLSGAQKITPDNDNDNSSFLNSLTYVSGLSTSAWALALWQSSDKTLQEIKTQLRKNLNKKLFSPSSTLNTKDATELIKNLVKKSLFQQPIGHVDIYGIFGMNILFHGFFSKLNFNITDTQIKQMIRGTMAFPIYTLIDPKTKRWFEVTPISTGFTDIGWIPIWALNRKFNNGSSIGFACTTPNGTITQQYAKEQTLGFFLGAFSSAYPLDVTNVLAKMEKINLDKAIKNDSELNKQSTEFKKNYKLIVQMILRYLKKTIKSTTKTSPATVFNYTYGIENSPIKNDTHFELFDGSSEFEIAIAPLLKPARKIDIIFILDTSLNHIKPEITELTKAFKWAKKNNKPFQDIYKYPKLGTESITIMDENKDAPIMVYMPLIKDANLVYTDNDAANFDLKTCKDCEKFNFTYTPKNFDGLWALAEQNMTLNKNVINEALKKASKKAIKRSWYQGALFDTVS